MAAGRRPEREDDAQGVVREREAGEDAHKRAAVPLDNRVPAAGVDDAHHVVVEGAVLWVNLLREQDREGRAGAKKRQYECAMASAEGSAKRGGARSSFCVRVRAGGDEELGRTRVSSLTGHVQRDITMYILTIDVRSRRQKQTLAGHAAKIRG